MVKKSTSVRCRIGDTELDASAGKVVEGNVEVIQVVESSKKDAIVVTGADPDEHYQRQTSHLRGGVLCCGAEAYRKFSMVLIRTFTIVGWFSTQLDCVGKLLPYRAPP